MYHIASEVRGSYCGLRRGTVLAEIPTLEEARVALGKLGKRAGLSGDPMDRGTIVIYNGFAYVWTLAYVASGRACPMETDVITAEGQRAKFGLKPVDGSDW